jgi:probable F420-dependent oxidoreductase
MQFGFTLKPESSIERTLSLTRMAEAAGFDHGWLFDSHVLWRDPYPLLTLMAGVTTRMRLGTCVTNPATREPSVTASALAVLNELSGGRMDLGIGRGDSARRVLGKAPTSMKDLEEAVHVIRALVEGRAIEYEGAMLELTWSGRHRLPIWIAGYGPVALKLTGRIADGAMPRSATRTSSAGSPAGPGVGRQSGRDPNALSVMAAAPAHVGDLADGRDRTRWFPALVSNHVVDLVNRYPREDLPPELTQYIREREGYDYLHHAEVGSSNATFVTDEIVDRFCLVGSVDQHIERLRALAEAGVTQFNLYLMNGGEEEQIEIYGREIIPALRDVAAAKA